MNILPSMDNQIGNELPYQLLITGPSGSGKSTLMEGLLQKHPEYFARPIQYTTRKPRHEGEKDEYVFLSHEQFLKKLTNGDFIEFTEYNKELYAIGKYFDKTKCNIFILEPVGREAIRRYFLLEGIKFKQTYISVPTSEMRRRLELRRESVITIENRLRDLKYFYPQKEDKLLDGTDREGALVNEVNRFIRGQAS